MASLQLINIKCIKKQDSISPDEPYITLDNSIVYSGSRFKKDVTRDLQSKPPYEFENQVNMKLYEKDRNSRDDFLGEVVILASQTGRRSARFNERSGADYEIFYEVSN